VFGRLLALCVLFVLIAGGAAEAWSGTQAPPPSAPADTTAPAEGAAPAVAVPDTLVPEPAPVQIPSTGAGSVIYGTVTLSNGYPLAELTTTLFVGGLEEASATTDTSGVFSIRHAFDMSADETVVLWLTPPRGMGLVREIIVLKESRASSEMRQFGPCMTRVPISDSTLVDLVVLDQPAYAAKLEESGCMDLVVEELGPEYDAGYNLATGDRFTLATSSSSRFAQVFSGQEMAVNTGSTANYSVVVDTLGPDGLALELEYQDRTYTTDSPQARGGVDFTPLAGRKVNMTLSSLGEPSRYIGFETLPEIEVSPNETLNRERYVNEFKSMFPTLPGRPIGEGGSWTNDYTVKETDDEGGLTTIDVSVTYTLVGETVFHGTPCLEIDAATVVTVKGQGTMRGNPYAMNMNGTGSEKIYFAHEIGMLLQKSGTTKIEGAIESSGMNIPIVSESETSIEVSLQ
jgi:hypothetical protein